MPPDPSVKLISLAEETGLSFLATTFKLKLSMLLNLLRESDTSVALGSASFTLLNALTSEVFGLSLVFLNFTPLMFFQN